MGDLEDAFADFDIELEDALEVDEERVLATQRFVGHFRATEIPFDGPRDRPAPEAIVT